MRLNTFIIIGIVLITISSVNAEFIKGNPSNQLKTSYSSNEPISGWINISLDDEPGNTKLTAFNGEITLFNLLDKNNFDCTTSSHCSCKPTDCKKDYSSQNSGTTTKSINLPSWQEKLIGIKLNGEISEISEFKFNLNSTVGDSCVSQLKIDLFDTQEWNAEKIKNNTECQTDKPYGCFNHADSIQTTSLETNHIYCEKINLKGRGFKIGAEVSGTGSAQFKMSANNKNCQASISQQGEFNCTIELNNEIDEETDVCLEVIQSINYSIPYETISPCGYTGEYDYDFKIFAKPLKYSAIGAININNTLIPGLTEELEDYIFNRYDGDCTNGCFIPILLKGIEQDITLSDLKLTYTSEGLTKEENNFYDLTEEDFLITSDYVKLELENSGLKVPSGTGTKQLILRLGNEEILTKNIELKKGVTIKDIIPKEVPSLVPVSFIALIEGNTTSDYEWDFGDGTKETSEKNKITHTYSEIGDYELEVKVDGKTKTISVQVKSPVDSVNRTINKYKTNLNNIQSKIRELEIWIQGDLNEKTKLNELTIKINEQEERTNDGIDEQEAIDIITKLLDLNIPNRLGTGIIINKVDFIQEEDSLDLGILKEMGAGNFEKERASYVRAINNWMNLNLDIKIESKTYTLYFDENSEDLVSNVKIYLTPKKDLQNIYFIINKDVEIKGEGIKNNKLFTELSGEKVIEFLYPERVTINNIPVYVSPKEEELSLDIQLDVCDNDGICEDDETSKNCKNDCKAWFSLTTMLIILLVITFIIYISLQEWYKRYYEKHLFPDKNQLFNLVHFMNNTLNQGLKKSSIFKKLENAGWKGEQLTYAWKKLHGKRTGMWEIPLFKWVENRQVKAELEKRGGIVMTNKLYPGKYRNINKRFLL